MEQNRKLKVYVKYSRKGKRFMPNPEIRLTGKWVNNCGFGFGNFITVRNIESGLIIINTDVNLPHTIEL